MPKLPQILNPKRRKPVGEYYRIYHGGEFDGIKERVPLFSRPPLLQSEVNKRAWYHTGKEWRYENNRYQLAEPPSKPTKGASYIYQSV